MLAMLIGKALQEVWKCEDGTEDQQGVKAPFTPLPHKHGTCTPDLL